MNDIQTILRISLYSVPIYGALICALLMLKLLQSKRSSLNGKVLNLLIFYYFASVLLWLTVVVFLYLPKCFVVIHPLSVLISMIVHVSYFHFIFSVTAISDREKFSLIHYFIPILVFCTMLVWSLNIPFQEQMKIFETQRMHEGNQNIFNLLFLAEPILIFVFNLVYAIKSLIRCIRYRRAVVNYSSDQERGAVRWIFHLIFTMFLILPLLACILFLSKSLLIVAAVLLVVSTVFKYTMLVHNVLFENFVLIEQTGCEGSIYESNNQQASVRQLEYYMKNKKPYLRPKLKITDVMRDLNTNRTSLSMLINRNYGMNFCRYVNRFRLQEFEKLRSDPAYNHFSDLDLILMVGFSDWRSYLRVKKQEEFVFKNQ